MYRQEEIKPYHQGEKGRQVAEMFDNIASTYDTLNHRLSWNIDRYWRKKALQSLLPYQPQSILDVATGTGDFALQAAEMLHPVKITGIDISEGMLTIARKKVEHSTLTTQFDLVMEDCMHLSYDDNTFDAVTAAFGIRNFEHLDQGLTEMCRVMKKGGHLGVVELTEPVCFPMRQLFHLYSHTVLPVYGRLVSKDSSAYSYLTKTIEAFPQGEQMMDILKRAGFAQTAFKRLTFGICTMYFATK